MNKMNIIQFLPYFPPHKGGLETHSEEWAFWWVKKGYGEVINIITDFNQDYSFGEEIIFEGKKIGYKKNGVENLIVSSFEIISNFPIYKIWTKDFRIILKYLKEKNINILITRTRFFLTSLIGGIFAKKHNFKWIHIEHGSDYVKLSSKFKTKIAYLYDRIIGKWIFKKADKIVAISEGVKDFILKEFVNREIDIIYRGLDFENIEKQENKDFIKIGFVGRLVNLKGVDLLIKVFSNLFKKYENIVLEILGDGDEKQNLEKLVLSLGLENKVKFLGLKDRDYITGFLSNCDILVNSSFQEGLPTTVLEGLLSSCVVVATDVGGTKEISNLDDLIIVNPGDLESLKNGLEKAILNYEELAGKSRDLVKEKFDWNKNIKKYFNLFKNL